MNLKLSILLVLLGAGVASAQIVPAMVNPSDTPLQLVSINSTLDDFLHIVTVRNASSRPITSFQLGLLMSVPEICGVKQVFGEEKLLRKDRVSIAPAAYVDFRDYRVTPESIGKFGVDNYAHVVLSQLAIVHVEFADGSVWDLRRSGRTYDDTQLSANAELQCVNASKVGISQAKTAASCGGKMLRVGGKFPVGGGIYICVGAADQACSNSVDGQSCTSTFCKNDTCPKQTCATGVVPPK